MTPSATSPLRIGTRSSPLALAQAENDEDTLAGVGEDLMGDWVLRRMADFGIDTAMMQLCPIWSTPSSTPHLATPTTHVPF